MADIEISLKARDELNPLDPPASDRIRSKLFDEVTEHPDRRLVRLSRRDDYRVRVGDYRVIIE